MTDASTVERGRESFARRDWQDAQELLAEAMGLGGLEPADLELLAFAASMTGEAELCAEAWTAAHKGHLAADDAQGAARCAFWVGFDLLSRGKYAQGSGWMARAESLLEDEDCVEQGYVMLPGALQLFDSGAAAEALPVFEEIGAVADRFHDPDLAAMARLGIGQSLLRLGEPSRGKSLLDECMVAVTASEISEFVAGIVYCAVIEACREMFDFRRAQEWTEALNSWCEAQPDLINFRGQCLVHRAALLQFRGEWEAALAEAGRAQDLLSIPSEQPAVGAAYYEQGEIHRLRGAFADAQAAYRRASDWGFSPEPGTLLLRLATGDVDGARAAATLALDEAADDLARSKILAAYVEIMLAGGDVETAVAGATKLSEHAAALDSDLLRARARQAEGAVALAQGNASGAQAILRQALGAWREMEVPYEAARVRVQIGECYRVLGDDGSADEELRAARTTFEQLSAAPDLARLSGGSPSSRSGQTGSGLTGRQLEVLRLLARGKSNREIADDLVISEHTVARHVQNIFAKIDVASRSAAGAWAHEQQLV